SVIEIKSLSLSREGKFETLIVFPKKDKSPKAADELTITKLSGCKMKPGISPLALLKPLIRHPFKFIGNSEVFLSSIHSYPGNPTLGEGSAKISSITISYC